VFGATPCLDIEFSGLEEASRFSIFVASSEPEALRCGRRWDPQHRSVVEPALDDHPFVYLMDRAIPPRYLGALALVLLASALFVRVGSGSFRPMTRYADLFCMGAAFLLLETKSVVQFALLFGTTWFVNALVFLGVLLSVLLAVEVERRVRIGRPLLLLALLVLALLAAWLVPTDWLLGLGSVPRLGAAVALSFSPIFVANLIFAERFRDAEDAPAAFGANLLGAIVGGTMEYVSLLTGFRALLLLVGLLYLAAYLLMPRSRGGSEPKGMPSRQTVAVADVSW
jgi:hypothetical protein